MYQRTIALVYAAAVGLWTVSVLLTAAGTIAIATAHLYLALALYAHAFLVLAGALTLTIRSSIDHAARAVIDRLEITQDIGGPLRRTR